MLSRRTFLQFLPLVPAALALRPLAAIAAPATVAPEPRLVIVNGWVLRHDDLAALPRGATAIPR